jgi:hypothetical protein
MRGAMISLLVGAALFAAMAGASLVGRMVARRSPLAPQNAQDAGEHLAAIFGLLGLLVAFTFSSVFARLDARRQLIAEEANAIGTAYLRLDLLPAEARPSLRDKFQRYTAARARLFDSLARPERARAELAKAAELQRAIWTEAVAASDGTAQPVRLLLLPALNDMIDITTTTEVAIRTHAPALVLFTLFAIALTCCGLVAYRSRSLGTYSGIHLVTFAVITFTLYLIVDVEFPSLGLVRLDRFDQVLSDLAASMTG